MPEKTKVAIYGMGVLGREVFREITGNHSELTIASIADKDISYENLLYLLKYDSVYHGDYHDAFQGDGDGNIVAYGISYPFEKITSLDEWKDILGCCVIDCSGSLTSDEVYDLVENYGAKCVISLYAPQGTRSTPPIVCYGVNDNIVTDTVHVICTGTVEDQVGAITLKFLQNAYGVENVYLNAFTAYTNAQHTIDSLNEANFARGRAGAWNISPLYTRIGRGVGKIIPVLNGKVTGSLYRAPVIDGGALIIDCILTNPPDSATALNTAFNNAIDSNEIDKLVLNAQTDRIVSSDVLSFESFQFIEQLTTVAFPTRCSVTVLYDNIRGLALQGIRLVSKLITNNIW